MLNTVLRFFDLYSQDRSTESIAQGAKKNRTAGWRIFVVYLACVLGVVLGPFALDAAVGKYTDFMVMFGSVHRLFWAVVFGPVLTAVLFKTVLSAKTDLLIQVGIAILAGFASGKVIPAAIGMIVKWIGGA